RLQQRQQRRRAVVRIRVDRAARLVENGLAERVRELLAVRAELAVRLAGDADVHPVRRRAGVGDRVAERAEPVGGDDLDARPETGPQVLDQLAAVLALQPAEEDGLGARVLDLRRQVLVARGL